MTPFMVTHMGFLPCMCSRMNRQRTALDKALVAILDGAVIGALIRMYSKVSAEI